MNLKTHTKGLIALALVFFMLAPMLMAASPVHAAYGSPATGSFSVVVDSNNVIPPNAHAYSPVPTSATSVTLPATPNPIGTVLAFDVMISGEANVWGWALPVVSWNPSVMQLSKVVEGQFLQDGGGTNFLVGSINNVAGSIGGGIADAESTPVISPDTTPTVVVSLYFTVSGYGNSQVNIVGTGANQAYLHSTAAASDPEIPVTATDATVTVSSPPLSISLYQHGSTSLNSLTEPSSTSPISDVFSVDAYVAGAVGNIWGWSLDITWNPAVLNLVSINEGTYLSNSGTTLFAQGSIDNNPLSTGDGSVQGGVNDALSTPTTATAAAGVLATFNFVVVGYGNSNINISPGVSQGALLTSSIPPQGIATTLNGFQYIWTAPPPTNPTAAITVTGSPLGPGTATLVNFGVTLSGTTSTPGIDEEPPNTACPIVSYSWSVLLVGASTPITFSGANFVLTNAQVGSQAGTIVATLTVNAPVPAGATQSPGYNPTASTTLDITVQTPASPGMLDVWTQNGGQGPYVDSSSFGPQQLVYLYAYVSYNGAPVVDKIVTFEISGPSGTSFVTAPTGPDGIATAQYRLPWQDSNPQQYFGQMIVNASVDVAGVTLTDTCNFYYGYQLNLNSVQITNGAGSPPSFDRYGTTTGGNVVDATVTVTNTMWNQQTFWLTATIYDNNNVPVAQVEMQESINAATPVSGTTNTWQNTHTQTYTITLTIPTWAYVGLANIYVNIFTAPPQNSGVAWSPQVSAPLQITAGFNGGVISSLPKEVLDVSYNVVNDEDTGLSGYWALDNYAKTVQVWSLGGNQYEVIATYLGTFTTYSGALSPEAGVEEQTGLAGVTGTLSGGYIGTFTATSFNPSSLATTGNIGTYDLGGSIADVKLGTYALQTGNSPSAFSVISTYFPGYSSFNYVTWGWTYTYTWSTGATSVWQNTSAGNSGDIVV